MGYSWSGRSRKGETDTRTQSPEPRSRRDRFSSRRSLDEKSKEESCRVGPGNSRFLAFRLTSGGQTGVKFLPDDRFEIDTVEDVLIRFRT